MKLPPEAEVQLVLEGGRTMVAFPDAKARFSIARVPAGTHSLYVFTSKFVFPPVSSGKLLLGAGSGSKGRRPQLAGESVGTCVLMGRGEGRCRA